jgi:putative oxidoreductase
MEGLEKLKPLALLLLRLGLGMIFIYYGYPKLANPGAYFKNFEGMGFPGYFSYLAGLIETFGGAMLIAGLFTRAAALLLSAEMAVAIARVHLPQGPITAVRNYQFPLALCLSSFALATIGAGLISIDHAIYGGGHSPSRKSRGKERN